MVHFDPEHLSWPFILLPAILIAAVLKLDNRYLGPYFAIADIALGDFGSGYKWNDREIIQSFTRRLTYVIVAGAALDGGQYRPPDIAAVLFIAGFLLIWPAFGHPLPVYARKSDWHVLLAWALYVLSIVGFGMFGAKLLTLIQAITGQSPSQFIREALLGSFLWLLLATVAAAFRVPVVQALWQRNPNRSGSGPNHIQNG